jgi:hypothetical protein
LQEEQEAAEAEAEAKRDRLRVQASERHAAHAAAATQRDAERAAAAEPDNQAKAARDPQDRPWNGVHEGACGDELLARYRGVLGSVGCSAGLDAELWDMGRLWGEAAELQVEARTTSGSTRASGSEHSGQSGRGAAGGSARRMQQRGSCVIAGVSCGAPLRITSGIARARAREPSPTHFGARRALSEAHTANSNMPASLSAAHNQILAGAASLTQAAHAQLPLDASLHSRLTLTPYLSLNAQAGAVLAAAQAPAAVQRQAAQRDSLHRGGFCFGRSASMAPHMSPGAARPAMPPRCTSGHLTCTSGRLPPRGAAARIPQPYALRVGPSFLAQSVCTAGGPPVDKRPASLDSWHARNAAMVEARLGIGQRAPS